MPWMRKGLASSEGRGLESAQAGRPGFSRFSFGPRDWLCALAICCPALMLLLWPGKEFGLDWPWHLWMTAYHGEYFRHHLAFPQVLNTDLLSGMPYPVFYGFLFFPAAGLLSIPLGADLAMRLILVTVTVLQCRHIVLLFRAVGGESWCGWTVALLFIWSIYPLTNLYNRGALPEYIAVALLTCSLCLFVRILLADPPGKTHRPLGEGAFIYYTLCACVHPLTAVFGGLFIALVMLSTLPFHPERRRIALWGARGVLATLLVLSPWIYVTAKYYRALALYEGSLREIIHFTDSLDQWWVRLAPFPLDVRMLGGEMLARNETPFLDAQLNVPLLLLGVILSAGLWAGGRLGGRKLGKGAVLWGVAALIFAVTLIGSVSPRFFGWFPAFFHSLQFAYRLVAYQNLALLGLVAAAVVLRQSPTGPNRNIIRPAWLIVCGMIALAGLVIKLTHGAVAMRDFPAENQQWREDRRHILHLSDKFYGWPAYAVLGETPTNCHPTKQVFLQVGSGDRFGQPLPTGFDLDKPREVLLQVQPFPWNQVRVNGTPLSGTELCRQHNGYIVALAPGHYELDCLWQPDRIWFLLNRVSKWILLVWIGLAWVSLTAAQWFDRARRSPRPKGLPENQRQESGTTAAPR